MDSVSVAFELMEIELKTEIENLNNDGAKHFRKSDYESARKLSEKGNLLASFYDRVRALADEWSRDYSSDFPYAPSTSH